MPKVSVIMPVFNGETYIEEAIASVLSQTMSDLELIVVNDGSTDDTLSVVQGCIECDNRVRVINRANSGRPSFPKNDGIAAAKGQYISFLDHDDLYDPDRVQSLADELERHPQWVAAFHDLRLITSDGDKIPGSYLADSAFVTQAKEYLMPLKNDWFECGDSFYIFQSMVFAALHTQSVIIAADRVPREALLFDTQFTICDDTDFWIRLGLMGQIGYLNRVLSSYRQHDSSITRNREKFLIDSILLHVHNFERILSRLSPEQIRQYRTKIGRYISELGYFRYDHQDLSGARASYRDSLRWAFNKEALLGFTKSCLPKNLLRQLRSTN